MKKLVSMVVVLFMLLCACGAPATNEPHSMGQETAAAQNTTTDGSNKETIEPAEPAVEETESIYENDPTRETFAVDVCFVLAAPDGTTYTVEKEIRAAGPVTNDEVHYWYNEINGINQQDIREIWFRSEQLDIDRIYCMCCETFERGEDGWFRLNFHHKQEYDGVKRDPE